MEYEGYLEESAPRWLQQFKEKTAAVQKEVQTCVCKGKQMQIREQEFEQNL